MSPNTHTRTPCKFKNSEIWGKKERKNLSATTDGHWTVRFTSMVRPCCHAWIHCLFTAHGCFDMVVSSFAKCTLDSKILKIIIQDSNLRFSVVDSLIPACVRRLGLAVRFYFECTMLCTKSRGTTTMCYGGGGRRALSGGLLNLYHYSNQRPTAIASLVAASWNGLQCNAHCTCVHCLFLDATPPRVHKIVRCSPDKLIQTFIYKSFWGKKRWFTFKHLSCSAVCLAKENLERTQLSW